MPSKPVLIFTAIALTVATVIFTISLRPAPQPPAHIIIPSPTPAETSTVTLDELALCRDFQKTEGEISCEEALNIAKEKYSGTIQNISSGIFQKEDTQPPEVSIWIIEIKLDTPVIKNNRAFERTRLFLRRDTGEEFFITRGAE